MMKKQLLTLILALLTAGTSFATSFSAENEDGVTIYYETRWNDSGAVYVTYKDNSYNSYTGDVVIPATVTYNDTEYNVTGVYDNAFKSCTGLTSVTLPESINTIASMAFYECPNLVSVNIPDLVTSIPSGCFDGCTSLASISIPESVTSIGIYAFRDCSSLTSVVIPDGVATLGQYSFYGCTSLASVTLPTAATVIPLNMFRNCSSLTSVTVPANVTEIQDYAFEGCTNLSSVSLPNGLVTLGRYVFQNCSSLDSIVLPESIRWIGSSVFSNTPYNNTTHEGWEGDVLYIGKYLIRCANYYDIGDVNVKEGTLAIAGSAFWGAKGLTSVTLPESLITIGSSAFSSCTALTSVTIPDNCEGVGAYAFSNSGLTSASISPAVNFIGQQAFSNCTALEKLYVYNTKPANIELDSNVFSGVDTSTCELNVPKNCAEAYRAADQWSAFTNVVEMAYSAIESVEAETPAEDANAPYYDLTGRRVLNPTPGLYIHNGRKVVIR